MSENNQPQKPAFAAAQSLPMPTPPERQDGFTYRDIFFTKTGSFFNNKITVRNINTSLNYVYGVAGYNVNTGMAEEIPERGWYKPKDGAVTFPILFGSTFVVTSDGEPESKSKTPAQRFNDGRGVKVVAPGPEQYALMRPVIASAVIRMGNTLVIRRTRITEQYTLINLNTGYPIYMWLDGVGGDLGFDFEKYPDFPVMAVERDKSPKGLFVPARPLLVPGADPAHTQASFDERTAQGLLTVDVTDGFAYAVADENGIPLDRKKKLFWSVTADTDQGLTVTEDELGFYEAPAVGKKILFRVPPGGTYHMLTRLDDGSVVKSDPITVPSTGRNLKVRTVQEGGRNVTEVRIEPVSFFAEYATKEEATGKVNQFLRPPANTDLLRFTTSLSQDDFVVVARPRPFSGPQPFPPFPPESSGEPQAENALPTLIRVKPGNVMRIGNEVRVTKVSEDQEYALYVPGTVNPASAWKKPEQGEVSFLDIRGTVQVVTRKSESSPLPSMIVQADGVSV